ncbi:caspase family protein [Streptomyces sp. NPDC085481]|uniref:caspase family protein n=1 Tax=Streptomyces sp. NPDC085481 TaxID=3365727 RepID=UPI0037CD830F
MTPPGGRRFLVTVGVSAYADPGIPDLPGVPEDVRRLRELLLPMGYEAVLDQLAADPTAAAIEEAVEDWAYDTAPGPDDIVVVYFAGHGVKAEDRHYLLGATARPGRYSAALAAEDLARPLLRGGAGHLLVVLDTCFAGAGAGEIAVLAAELAHTQRGSAGRWVLAAARGKERARENVFVDALAAVLKHPQAGAHQEFLGVREVTERINRRLIAGGVPQRVSHSAVDSDGRDPFFRNRAHIAGLPADALDLETLNRLRRETRGHFEARGRGVEHSGEHGDHFTGRTKALAALTSWLAAERHDQRARVVTGDPGSGKSALLGRLLRVEEHREIVPLHCRRAALEDLSTALAAALRLPGGERDDVLEALGRRTAPVTILVDALDEAGTAGLADEGLRIARELLRPLSSLPAVRLVVGTRRPLLPALGRAVEVLDLDGPAYTAPEDVAAYAAKLLLADGDPDTRSPYRGRPVEAAEAATGIAARAGHSFLVARMTARALVEGQLAADTSRPGWERALPADAGEAFAGYLARFGPDRPRVERLLRPLAYAQGAGLPWSTLWAPLAEALSGLPCPQDDLRWLHRHAGAYVVETATPAGSAYRLFHETMAEWLRAGVPDPEAHRALASALPAAVPADPRTGLRDWPAAHPYIRDHLATHAAAGGALDSLLTDPEYLAHASPPELLRALGSVRTAEGRLWRSVYRASADVHRHLPAPARRDVLAVDAARFGEREAATALARTRAWRPRWATGSEVHTALVGAFHTRMSVAQVAVVEIEDQWHAVGAGEDGVVHLWNLRTGAGRSLPTATTWACVSAFCVLDEGPALAFVDGEGRVVVWDLVTLTPRVLREVPMPPHQGMVCVTVRGRVHAVTTDRAFQNLTLIDLATGDHRAIPLPLAGEVSALAATVLDGVAHTVTAERGAGVLRLVNLGSGAERDLPGRVPENVFALTCTTLDGVPHVVSRGHGDSLVLQDLTGGPARTLTVPPFDDIYGLATTTLHGRPHAVAACGDLTVRVWDLLDGTERLRLTGHAAVPDAVSCHEMDGRPYAITCEDTVVRVWDLSDGTPFGATLPGHAFGVVGATVAERADGPCVVTAGWEGTVRLWDLEDGTPLGVLTNRQGNFSDLVSLPEAPSRVVTASAGGALAVWDVDRKEEVLAYGRTSPDDTLGHLAAFRLDGRAWAVVTSDDTRLWQVDSGVPRRLSLPGALRTRVGFTWLEGRPVVVSGRPDGSLVLLDARTDRVLSTLGAASGPPTTALACGAVDERPVAVVGDDKGALRVWDLATGRERARLTGHTARVNTVWCGQLHGVPHAVTGADDRTLRLWELTTGRHLDTVHLPLAVEAVAVRGDDVVVGMSGEVVLLTRQPPPPPRPPSAPRTPPG